MIYGSTGSKYKKQKSNLGTFEFGVQMPDYLRNRDTAEPSGGERERKFPPQNKPSRTKAS